MKSLFSKTDNYKNKHIFFLLCYHVYIVFIVLVSRIFWLFFNLIKTPRTKWKWKEKM